MPLLRSFNNANLESTINAQLPTEVWRQILRQATHLEYSTTWDYDPDDRIWADWQYEQPPDATNSRTKHAIVRVCHEWRVIGSEYLYEIVTIPSSSKEFHRIPSLVEAFEGSASISPSGLGHGWWTKRINCPGDVLLSSSIVHFLRLLEQCHNLQVLCISGVVGAPKAHRIQLAQLLQSRFSHSLRRLELFGEDLMEDQEFTKTLPDIEIQSLGISFSDVALDVPLHQSLINITTLTLDLATSIHNFPLTWTFPFLRNLAFLRLESSDRRGLTPFLKRHGDTLRCLHIRSGPFSPIGNLLPSLISSTPSLQSLSLKDFDLANLTWPQTISPSGLTHIGITLEDDNSTAALKSVMGIARLETFPDLKLVQFLNWSGPGIDSAWMDVLEMCSKSGVELRNRYGKPIGPALDGQSHRHSLSERLEPCH